MGCNIIVQHNHINYSSALFLLFAFEMSNELLKFCTDLYEMEVVHAKNTRLSFVTLPTVVVTKTHLRNLNFCG